MPGVEPCDEPASRLGGLEILPATSCQGIGISFDRMGLMIVADATLIFNRLYYQEFIEKI